MQKFLSISSYVDATCAKALDRRLSEENGPWPDHAEWLRALLRGGSESIFESSLMRWLLELGHHHKRWEAQAISKRP